MDSLFSIWSPLFSTSWHSWDRLALAYDYLDEAGRLDDEVEELQHAERHGLQLPIPGPSLLSRELVQQARRRHCSSTVEVGRLEYVEAKNHHDAAFAAAGRETLRRSRILDSLAMEGPAALVSRWILGQDFTRTSLGCAGEKGSKSPPVPSTSGLASSGKKRPNKGGREEPPYKREKQEPSVKKPRKTKKEIKKHLRVKYVDKSLKKVKK